MGTWWCAVRESKGGTQGWGKVDLNVADGWKDCRKERLVLKEGRVAHFDAKNSPSNGSIIFDVCWARLDEIHARLPIQRPSGTLS